MENDRKIIFITDLIDQRIRKEQEIEYYEEQLKEIEKKLFFLRKEHDLTKLIITIIEGEQVHDIRENMIANAREKNPENDYE